jgi:hypothetical protein
MNLDHAQRCQLVTDAVDIFNDHYRWWRISKLLWIARGNMADIPLAQHKKIQEFHQLFLK